MDRGFGIGDSVLCTESGVEGEVLSFYVPTSCAEQTKILTNDGRKYHAPTSTWVKFDGKKEKHSPSKMCIEEIRTVEIDLGISNVIKHIIKWNRWRKNNLNSKTHKFLVLMNIVKSPTFGVYKWSQQTRKAMKESE